MSKALEMIRGYGHEEVAFFNNAKAGLKAIIALHSTALGPAVGGCRLYPYESEEDALFDVLRLSRGMTYKNAVAGLPCGGAKCVVIASPEQKSRELFEALGEAVDSLNGRYFTAEDVNTTTQDMEWVLAKTKQVTGRKEVSGDPSPFTAIGTFDGIRAMARFLFGSDDLKGRRIALQGLGHVGFDLAGQLHRAGAELIVSTHSNRKNMETAVKEWGAKEVSDDEIYSVDCDIIAPCALGATINPKTIAKLKCKGIAGAANNQLLDPECNDLLKKKGIAYAPDFVINGGGVINAAQEVFTVYDKEKVLAQVHNIYNTVLSILEESKKTGAGEEKIAIRMAEERIRSAK